MFTTAIDRFRDGMSASQGPSRSAHPTTRTLYGLHLLLLTRCTSVTDILHICQRHPWTRSACTSLTDIYRGYDGLRSYTPLSA
eukprot:653345-Rhodomonas_salina.4